MKLALIGGMVNVGYTMGGVFAADGRHDIVCLRDPEDPFLPHQPLWLDQRIKRDSTALWTSTIDGCLTFDREQGWQAPPWYTNPLDTPPAPAQQNFTHIRNPIARLFFKRRYARSPSWQHTLAAMKDADAVIACGVFPAMIARLSGKPYMVWSYGADIRLLMGLEKRATGWRHRLYDAMSHIMLKDAYDNADAVGFNYGTDIYCSGGVNRLDRRMIFPQARVVPFPTFYLRARGYAPQPVDHLVTLPKDKINVLIPSRIDYAVKGHDRLLEAIQALESRARFHFIFTGWGHDRARLQDDLNRRGIAESITVLNVMLSRPLVHDLANACDIVIDQFNLGIYGAAALEGMSFRKPVIMYIDTARSGHDIPPPVVNCRTTEQILSALRGFADGTLDKEAIGNAGYEWVRTHHSDDIFIRAAEEVFVHDKN